MQWSKCWVPCRYRCWKDRSGPLKSTSCLTFLNGFLDVSLPLACDVTYTDWPLPAAKVLTIWILICPTLCWVWVLSSCGFELLWVVWGDYSGLAEVCSIGLLLFSYLTVVRLDILGALMTLVLHDNPRRIFPNPKQQSKSRAKPKWQSMSVYTATFNAAVTAGWLRSGCAALYVTWRTD